MPGPALSADPRAFVRSLNVVLKSARLYGVSHVRTASQIQAAWDDLRALLHAKDGSVTLGAAGSQLLLDGAPIESAGTTERSFAEFLTAAGLASLQFSPRVTTQDFQGFVAGFAAAGGKTAGLVEHLKKALAGAGESTIRINEVRFVAEDAALGERSAAASLTASSTGIQLGDVQLALSDPQQLLQLIAAAQGTVAQHGNAAAAASASNSTSASSGPVCEEDVLNVFRLVTSLAHAEKSGASPASVPQQVATLPVNSQELFRQGLAALARLAPAQRPEGPLLLQLAEHLAIRYALERYERGEVKVNAVRDLLERSSREMATLRKVLAAHEERMARAGLEVESHADVLDRQFWAAVPASGKRAVLLSAEAWCIPPRNVRQFVEELLNSGDATAAGAILLNYTSCVGNEDAQVRRKVAAGLASLAGLYARCEGPLLASAIRCVAEQARLETEDEISARLAECYNKLTQEAAGRRDYATLHTAIRCSESAGKPLSRVSFADRLPEFVEDAVRATSLPPDLSAVLSRTPEATAAQVAARFGSSQRRDECQRLFEIFALTGDSGVAHLTHTLRNGADAAAAASVGLLSQFAPKAVDELLPVRMPHWNRAHHDAVVRQLATAAAPGRGRLLVKVFPQLHKRVLAEAVDEMGMSQETLTVPLLMRLARGEAPQAADPLVRVKAVEALGRLRAGTAGPYLRSILEARRLLAWEHPAEMRIVAAQAMAKIDPEWMRDFLSRSGLPAEQMALAPLDPCSEAPWARQRRYARVPLKRSVEAVAETMRGACKLTASLLSLGGGMASAEFPLSAGSQVGITLRNGLRRVEAQVLVRDAARQQVGFEIVEMNLEERNKLRRLIAGLAA